MKKLTKIIKKRNKNYKPTIGLQTEAGRRISFNAELFYIEKALQEKLEAERYAKKFVRDFIKEKMPEFDKFINMLEGFGSFMYY